MEPAIIDVKAAAKQQALLALAQVNDGVLAPAAVVDAARDAKSALHDEFEWDDSVAAEGFRLAQAGALIRRMRLTIVRVSPPDLAGAPKVEMTLTRQFQSRPALRGPEGGYEQVTDILEDPMKRAELLNSVMGELRGYRRRYSDLAELASVWDSIDSFQLQASLAPKGGDSKRQRK